MLSLLKYSLLVEPDRQRLSRFVLSAVEELGGNMFTAAVSLNDCMVELDGMLRSQDEPVDISLVLENTSLCVDSGTSRFLISSIPEVPSAETIDLIVTLLSQQSELADPELLRQRNARISEDLAKAKAISEDLEKAKARAAEEMAQLEKQLETRRIELECARKDAETDSMTELYNRGAYDNHLNKSIARCQRQNEPLCLLMLDVDNFKQINDSYGHLYGDEYLRTVARSMEYSCRNDVDHCCRTGGDEFAIILYCELKYAERVARKILEKMDNNVSMGIAQMLPDDTPTLLAERCDVVLYEAKENGRGQFVSSKVTPVKFQEKQVR